MDAIFHAPRCLNDISKKKSGFHITNHTLRRITYMIRRPWCKCKLLRLASVLTFLLSELQAPESSLKKPRKRGRTKDSVSFTWGTVKPRSPRIRRLQL